MRRKLTSLLKTADLKDEEIKIYLLLLKLKKTTAAEISELSGIHFVNVYRALKKLKEKGLIKSSPINSKQSEYSPLSLQNLISQIKNEKQKLSKLEEGLKNIDPLLSYLNIDEEIDEPIEIKSGIDAMKEEYLKLTDLCEEEMLPMGNVDNFLMLSGYSVDCPEERNFIQQRLKRGIYVRMMNPINEIGEILRARDSFEKRTMKLTEKQPITDNFLVITDSQSTLFVCDEDDPKAVVIKEPELIKMQRDQFHQYWGS